MKYITLIGVILMISSSYSMAADQSLTNAQILTFSDGRVFSSITRSNNTLNIGIPLTAIRFILRINDENMGFAEPLHTVTLKTGDTLELVEKHHTIQAHAEVTPDDARLNVTTTFDARSFGDSIKTEHFVFREEKTHKSFEQSGAGYPPQGVGSPDP